MMSLPRTGVPHLWIVLTNPDPVTKKALVVMVVSEKSTTDKTVTLRAGDHPFIRHNSNIDYGGARLFDVERLEEQIVSEDHALQQDLSETLFESVRKGIFESSRTINWIKDYCRTRFEPTGETLPEKM